MLEKLVHIDDPALLPDRMMLVQYDVPDELAVGEVAVDGLPQLWRTDRAVTMGIGNAWLDSTSTCLLRVPSVVVPVRDTRDRNVLVHHRHAAAARITIFRIERFTYDPRLFAFG